MEDIINVYSGAPLPPINSYVDESEMAHLPEVELWDFIEQGKDEEWVKYAEDTGANLTDTYNPVPVTRLPIDEKPFLEWAMKNKHLCQKKFYEPRVYHKRLTHWSMKLPGDVGYNHRNTVEYNWGLYGDSTEQLKELLGGQAAFDQIGMDKETALMRLLVYMPGNVLPWHFDTLQAWSQDHAYLNPRIIEGEQLINGEYRTMKTHLCDIGKVVRRTVTLSDWHWGHILQFNNSFFPPWKSGEVWDIPQNVYHLSANVGIKLKVTMTITGVDIREDISQYTN